MTKYLLLSLLLTTHIFDIHASDTRMIYEDSKKNMDPLFEKISLDNCRYTTMQYALQLMEERKVKTIVETGTARGGKDWCNSDGCSTLIWGAVGKTK